MARKKKPTGVISLETVDADTNTKKSVIAQSRPRIGGKFVKLDENGHVVTNTKTPKKININDDEEVDLMDLAMDRRSLTPEEKEYIGTDPMRLLEVGLKNARTLSEGIKYAQALIKYKHPSLSAVKTAMEVEVTDRRIVWGSYTTEQAFVPISSRTDEEELHGDSIALDVIEEGESDGTE